MSIRNERIRQAAGGLTLLAATLSVHTFSRAAGAAEGRSPAWSASGAASSATPAAAAASSSPAPGTVSEQPTAGAVEGPLYVQVVQRGFDADPQRVREALARELGVALTPDPESAAVHVRVTAERGAAVAVSYRVPGSEGRVRTVTAPARDDEVAEVAALIAGNLARDYSGALIAQLQAQATPDEAQATPDEAQATPDEARAVRVGEAAPPAPASAAPDPSEEPETELKETFFNLSAVAPVALFPDAPTRRFNLELGMLYSHVGGISGVGLNGLVLRSAHAADGVLVGGAVNVHGGPVQGATIAGAVNVAPSYTVDGLQLGGAVNVAGPVSGVQLAGAVNVASAHEGVQLAGAVNVTQGSASAQVAGAVNATQVSDGVQLAGAVNVASESASGLQLGTLNVAGTARGAQIGVLNIGGEVEGLQLGIVNVAKSVKGASVGMITYSEQGRTQLVTWYSTTQPMNLGARFYTGPLYAMPTLGYHPSEPDQLYLGGSLGARIWMDKVFVDLEGNYQHRLDTGTGEMPGGFDEHDVQLRYRLLAGYELTPWLGAFVGGGVRHRLHRLEGDQSRVSPEFSAGFQFF